jgi:predicted MPP superfamily phosphohydrolase
MRAPISLFVAAITTGIAAAGVTRMAIRNTSPPAHAADALAFAVIGDNGTGEKPQYEVGTQMARWHAQVPFQFVIMLGDNLYGRQEATDFVNKFARPYAALLDAGVPFFASLGNHDDQRNCTTYPPFNMRSERYYTFTRNGVRFFVLDTNLLDSSQLEWFQNALKQSTEAWKIAYFHHPLYSDSRRHGSQLELRVALEPLLVKYGVSVVFSGHDHSYERFKPQQGITYFLAGSGGQLRRGDISPTPLTAAYFDQDQAFVVVEIVGDEMRFQTISRTGRVVDSGTIPRRTP